MHLKRTHGNLRPSLTHKEFLRTQTYIESLCEVADRFSASLLDLATSNPTDMQVNKHMVYSTTLSVTGCCHQCSKATLSTTH